MNHKFILSTASLFCCAVIAQAQTKVTDSLEVVKAVANSPAELLKGQVSGVRVSSIDGSPNGELNVNIRGINSLRGDSQPVWIVDGAVIGSSINQNLNPFFAKGELTLDGTGQSFLEDFSGKHRSSVLGNFSWLNPYEIESIEVIKDMSAAALYGLNGANGVIIVKTKRAKSGEKNLHWNSNVGIVKPDAQADVFSMGILHNHSLMLNGVTGNNSNYGISAFIRQNNGAVQNTGSTDAGLAIHFETMANSVFHFGLNSFISYGEKLSTGGANQIGSPSTMILARKEGSLFSDTLDGWIEDYDDYAQDYRTVNSVWLDVNFLPGFKFRAEGGMDYQNQNRFFWYGDKTSFGADHSGAAGILNNSLFSYNVKAALGFNRNFAIKHHLDAKAGADLDGYMNKTNAMGASTFELPFLRAKGMTSNGSRNALRKYNRNLNRNALFAALKYDYDNVIGLSGAAHYDYNQKYEKSADLFWGADTFFNIGELFIDDNTVISTVRLDGGYGIAGKFIAMPYEYIGSYICSVADIPEGTGNYYDGADKLISKEYNIGFIIGFMKDRFSLSAKYYKKETEDLFRVYNFGKLNSSQYVKAKNWSLYDTRDSFVTNSGIEMDLALALIMSKNCEWSVRANYAYNFDREFSICRKDLDFRSLVPVSNNNVIPSMYGGFGTTLALKNFTFDTHISNVAGFDILNAHRMIARGSTKASAEDFEHGDYFRLDNVSLSYDIPNNVKWINNLKVTLSAHNLLTLTDYSGWNPDVNCFGISALSNGIDYGSFPICRSIVLGLSVNF